jgi:hypothetical protein
MELKPLPDSVAMVGSGLTSDRAGNFKFNVVDLSCLASPLTALSQTVLYFEYVIKDLAELLPAVDLMEWLKMLIRMVKVTARN